jgi:two-component system, cell cycle sensor histidine kinase and response regulator CckA
MGVHSADPIAVASGPKSNQSWSLKVYVVAFVVVFVVASGCGLIDLALTNKLSAALLAITFSGLVVFLAAALVFYWRIARLIAKAGADVEATARRPAIAESSADAITERRRHQSERLQSLGVMAGAVAPDFSHLLAVIMNYADLVAKKTTDRSAVRADVEQIRVAAQCAARIAEQLLIIGRTAQPEALELSAIVAGMEDLLSATVGEGVEIEVDAAADLPLIEADRGQLEQVILNLAVNARDAMPQGGTLTIESGLTELHERHPRMPAGVSAGRYVELTVADTGKGMSADFATHIFEPLFTTKPVGRGNGLGLTTAHAIVTCVGGRVSVLSEEGTGTTMRLLFPATGMPAPAKPPADIVDAR